ncbi:hypothetical protein L208DRAFT_1248313, partial [Tricholoma matsutake]
ILVFSGPVHRTNKRTKTGLNWTGKDWTRGLYMDQSFAVQLLVFHFKKYSRTNEKPVFCPKVCLTLLPHIFTSFWVPGSSKMVKIGNTQIQHLM